MSNPDYIALVATAIKSGEKTRAQLKAECNITYDEVAMALYELVDIQDNVGYREDTSGIQHFRWVGGDLTSPRLQPAAQHEASDNSMHKTPSTLGVSISAEVLNFVNLQPLNYEFNSTQIAAQLRKQFPILKECDVPANVNTAVSAALSRLCGKRAIAIVYKGKAGQAHRFARLATAEDNHNKTSGTELEYLGIEEIESAEELPQITPEPETGVVTASEPENQPTGLQTAENEPIVNALRRPCAACHKREAIYTAIISSSWDTCLICTGLAIQSYTMKYPEEAHAGWPSYAELEQKVEEQQIEFDKLVVVLKRHQGIGGLPTMITTWTEWIDSQLTDYARVREENKTLRCERDGEVWVWQGDAEDHLESLVCPILIQPVDLREIIYDRDRFAAESSSSLILAKSISKARDELVFQLEKAQAELAEIAEIQQRNASQCSARILYRGMEITADSLEEVAAVVERLAAK